MGRYEDSDFVCGEDFDALFSDEEEVDNTSSSIKVSSKTTKSRVVCGECKKTFLNSNNLDRHTLKFHSSLDLPAKTLTTGDGFTEEQKVKIAESTSKHFNDKYPKFSGSLTRWKASYPTLIIGGYFIGLR